MDLGEDLFLLGGASFRPSLTARDIVLSEQLVYALIVEPREDVFWAIDDEAEIGTVCLSRHRDRFEDDDRFTLVGYSRVNEDRTTRVSGELVEDLSVFDWQQGETVYFVAFSEDKLVEECRMVPEDELWGWFDAVVAKSA